MRQLLGIFLIIVSASSFGAMAIFAHFAYADGAGVQTILFLRFAIAAVTLIGIMLAWKIPLPQGKNLLKLGLIGGIGFVGQSLCFFSALTLAPAGLVGLLLYLYPTLVMGMTIVFLKERPTAPKLIALGLASLGTVLTIGFTSGGQVLGIVLGIASAVIYASYVMVGSQILRQEAPIPASTVIFSAAALVFGGLITIQGAVFPRGTIGWLAVVAIALISTALAVITFFAGIQLLGAVNASTLSTLEPLVTILLAALILHQSIQPLQVVGGLLILTAVIVLARQGLQKRSQSDSSS